MEMMNNLNQKQPEITEEEIKKPPSKKLRKEPKKNKTGIMKSIKM